MASVDKRESMKQKPIKIGIDFDGVLAYNPFRLVRSPVTFVKRHILGVKKLEFIVPKTKVQQAVWSLLHESSIFPAMGVPLLEQLVDEGVVEAHLVTARYSFLQNSLYRWLERHKLRKLFASITINKNDEQPHLYKTRVVTQNKFDYFIEDNLDIVTHLSKGAVSTRVLWIYNILDRGFAYPYKFPYLKKALEAIYIETK